MAIPEYEYNSVSENQADKEKKNPTGCIKAARVLTIISIVFSIINIIPNILIFVSYEYESFHQALFNWVPNWMNDCFIEYVFLNFYALTLPALFVDLIAIGLNIIAVCKAEKNKKRFVSMLGISILCTLAVYFLAKYFIGAAW